MSRRIKKFGSRLGLRMGGQTQDSQRNVTPPSSANPDDQNITPPNQIIEASWADTPDDPNIITPPTPPAIGRPSQSKPKSSLIAKIFGTSSKQVIPVTHPELLEEGLTGSDDSLPVFDGTSTDPADHLIDVDTESMERHPDVRLYFYLVGRALDDAENSERPIDHEARKAFDDKLVGEGREYLKAAKARGDGYFISPKRDILADNQPTSRWYRLPTIGIVEDIVSKGVNSMEDEGYLHDTRKEWEVLESGVLSTNIRVPNLWAGCYRAGLKPGTVGWDRSVQSLYVDGNHPAYQVMSRCSRDEIIFDLMTFSAGANDPLSACLRPEVEFIMSQHWPDLERPWFRSEYIYEDPGFNNVPNNTIDQFLGRAPP